MTQLNRGQMIDQALQRVGNNSNSMKMQARVVMNRLLADLYRGYDWPFLWTGGPITIPPSGIFPLPIDFLKMEDSESLVLRSVGGQPCNLPIHEVDHKTFRERVTAVQSQYPQIWTIDYATMAGAVMPRPLEACQAYIAYKRMPVPAPFTEAEGGTPELYDQDKPIFPWDSFLIDSMTDWAMSYEVDPRRAEQYTINESALQRLRAATWPERSFPSFIPLDPLRFSTPDWGEKV